MSDSAFIMLLVGICGFISYLIAIPSSKKKDSVSNTQKDVEEPAKELAMSAAVAAEQLTKKVAYGAGLTVTKLGEFARATQKAYSQGRSNSSEVEGSSDEPYDRIQDPKSLPDATTVAIDVASKLLKLQFTLGEGNTQQLMSDNFALGYIFGFIDGIFQAMKIDNQVGGFAAMTVIYVELLGDQSTGARVMRYSLDLQSDQAFMKGMIKGGQEAIEFTRVEKSPMGLTSHLRSRR